MIFSSRILYSILLYTLLMILIYLQKPKLLFNKNDNSIRHFGFNNDESLYTYGTLSVILAIISYYIFAIIDYIFS